MVGHICQIWCPNEPTFCEKLPSKTLRATLVWALDFGWRSPGALGLWGFGEWLLLHFSVADHHEMQSLGEAGGSSEWPVAAPGDISVALGVLDGDFFSCF